MKSLDRWLLAAVGGHLLLFIERSEGISAYELIFSAIFYPGLMAWFLIKWLRNDQIIKGKSELFIFLFLLFGFISIIIGNIYESDIFKGIREWMLFFPYLLYFPLRDYIVDVRRLRTILWIVLVIASLIALMSIVRYYTALGFAQYLFEIWGKRQVMEEPLYMSSVIIGISLLAAGGKPRWLLFAIIVINIVSLAFTFSRGYWVATAAGIGLILLLSDWKVKRRIVLWGSMILCSIIAVILLVFPNLFNAISEGILLRLTSIGYGDISFQSRLIESRTVVNLFFQSPIIGYGFGSLYSYYDLISQHHAVTWYIHNGYFFLLFKVGILGSALYFLFYISRTYAVFRRIVTMTNNHIKSLICGLSVIPLVMLLLSFSSPQFYDRASVLVLTIVWGIAAGLKQQEAL